MVNLRSHIGMLAANSLTFAVGKHGGMFQATSYSGEKTMEEHNSSSDMVQDF